MILGLTYVQSDVMAAPGSHVGSIALPADEADRVIAESEVSYFYPAVQSQFMLAIRAFSTNF
jgi:hypothetical protein